MFLLITRVGKASPQPVVSEDLIVQTNLSGQSVSSTPSSLDLFKPDNDNDRKSQTGHPDSSSSEFDPKAGAEVREQDNSSSSSSSDEDEIIQKTADSHENRASDSNNTLMTSIYDLESLIKDKSHSGGAVSPDSTSAVQDECTLASNDIPGNKFETMEETISDRYLAEPDESQV